MAKSPPSNAGEQLRAPGEIRPQIPEMPAPSQGRCA